MRTPQEELEIINRRLAHCIDDMEFWNKEWENTGDQRALKAAKAAIEQKNEYLNLKLQMVKEHYHYSSSPIGGGPVTFKLNTNESPRYYID
jgi:hypothetical protein